MSTEYDWFIFSVYIAKAHKKLMEAAKPRARDFFAKNEEVASRVVETIAEAMAVNDGVVPPRYASFTKCTHCGEMPCPEEYPPETTRCPWCDVRWHEVATSVKEEWEKAFNGKDKRVN